MRRGSWTDCRRLNCVGVNLQVSQPERSENSKARGFKKRKKILRKNLKSQDICSFGERFHLGRICQTVLFAPSFPPLFCVVDFLTFFGKFWKRGGRRTRKRCRKKFKIHPLFEIRNICVHAYMSASFSRQIRDNRTKGGYQFSSSDTFISPILNTSDKCHQSNDISLKAILRWSAHYRPLSKPSINLQRNKKCIGRA